MKRKVLHIASLTIVAAVLLAACGGTATPAAMVPGRLQLQWVAQSQFAGYYAAVAEGYYKEEGLDVTILEGAPDIVPQQVCANGGAEFCLAWVPKALQSREGGADLVNISQVFQRSGTLEVSFASKGINGVADLKGKRVGVWDFGNEHEVFAALRAAAAAAQLSSPGSSLTTVRPDSGEDWFKSLSLFVNN